MSQSCTARGCTYPGTAFHCGIGGCHETFISLAGFDIHRRGPVDDRSCDPDIESLGLVRADGLWGTDREHAVRQVRVAQATRARQAK